MLTLFNLHFSILEHVYRPPLRLWRWGGFFVADIKPLERPYAVLQQLPRLPNSQTLYRFEYLGGSFSVGLLNTRLSLHFIQQGGFRHIVFPPFTVFVQLEDYISG